MEEVSVIFSKIPFVGKYLFDGIFGMTTGSNAEREIGAVMEGSGRYFRCQDKSVAGIDRSMFFETIMRDIIFDCPVRLEITRENLRGRPFLSSLPAGVSLDLFLLLQLFLAPGMAGRFHEAGINGNAFVDG